MALAEACISGPAEVGADVDLPAGGRGDVTLFGEGASRILVSLPPKAQRHFESLMDEWQVPWRLIGTVGGDRLIVKVGGAVIVSLSLEQIAHAWRTGFERYVS